MNLPDELACLLREVPALSSAYLVGGCVRDSLLGIAHKDFDLEVYGVGYEVLARALSAHGRVDLVGKSFGVIKFTGQSGGQWDFSLPRRDSKISTGHKGRRNNKSAVCSEMIPITIAQSVTAFVSNRVVH